MPIVNIDMVSTTKEIKKEIIEKVTDTLSDITKIPRQSFTIIISEKSADDFGIGGEQLSEKMSK